MTTRDERADPAGAEPRPGSEILEDRPAFVPAEHGPTRAVQIAGGAVSGLAALPALRELIVLITTQAPAGGVHDLSPLFGWATLALSGYSLVIVLTQLHRAVRWHRDTDPRERPPHLLRDAHTLPAFWAAGVGGSLALVGLLGMWSAYDGNLSGLEPGWHLLFPGLLIIAAALGAKRRTDHLWDEIETRAIRYRGLEPPPLTEVP